jgi:hypothetical protein
MLEEEDYDPSTGSKGGPPMDVNEQCIALKRDLQTFAKICCLNFTVQNYRRADVFANAGQGLGGQAIEASAGTVDEWGEEQRSGVRMGVLCSTPEFGLGGVPVMANVQQMCDENDFLTFAFDWAGSSTG